ncbi:hypothetical protein [Levilactobacillus koreensis]
MVAWFTSWLDRRHHK